MSGEPVRLSKLMAQRGICSRREADDYISRGLVLVDGTPVSVLGTKVLPHQSIALAPEALARQQERVTILLNKPIGFVSGQPEKGYHPAAELITPENREPGTHGPTFDRQHLMGLAPAGRLDIDSKGLLVFTQDGRLARRLTSHDSALEKEYLVRIAGQADSRQLELLRHGLALDGVPLKPARVESINPHQLRFILKEGRKRQIRKMCELVGLDVTGLKRVRIGRIRLGRLTEGRWRYLEPGEDF
jgi:23S rRNA pseudouridine2604 synthase